MAKIPVFKNEDEEREFWATHSTAEYIDTLPPVEIKITASRSKKGEANLKISAWYLGAIRKVAQKKGVSSQALVQTWLMERLTQETPETIRK
ncbi:BrnA antitoxin family protein [bacterium]|nr:BrnA antitoxin family protein [bacterium]